MTAQIFNLGKLRFTYKGTYSGSTTYQLNDVVKYTNNVYVYINTGATSGNAPTNTAYWAMMVEGLLNPTTGTAGQLLSTDGTNFDWTDVDLLPSLSGNANKILVAGAQNASWTSTVQTLDITSDLEAASTSGSVLFGPNAREDNEGLGTNVKSVALKAITSNVATLTTSSAHGFAPFQMVNVALVPADARFDGLREVIATPTTTTFTFEAVNPNLTATVTGGSAASVPGYNNAIAAFATDADDYAQVAFRNASDATNASTDFIAYANNGTDFAGYIDLGITSSQFGDPEFTITGPNDGYIFMSAPYGTTGSGNLVLATNDTGTDNKIIFAAGGLASDNTQMSITPDLNVHVEIPTPSTSPTTGAFTVVGGVGIQGDMNIQGSVSIVGNLTFGGGSTTTENLAVTAPFVFSGDQNSADVLDLGFIGEYATTVSAITATVTNKALTSNVATLTTSSAHTYLVGDQVTITGVDSTFNGTYGISAIPSSTTFTYAKTSANVSSTAVSPTGSASVSARRKFSGVVRDASDGTIKFFSDATTKPTTSVNFAEAGISFADIQVKNIISAGTITSSGTLTVSGGANFTGTVDMQEMRETLVPVSISSNIAACSWTAGNIYYIGTAPSANFTIDLTNVPTDNDKTLSLNVLVTQGSTGRIPSAMNINGSVATIRWAGGATPAGTNSAGKIDIFNFTLIRTGSAWIVLGGANQNF
jgi:hypothetical protein